MAGLLDCAGAVAHNFRIAPDARQETLDRLRDEIAELRASRRRLVLAADAERRSIERELHDGLQQQLVALAVNLQLADTLLETDAAGAGTLLDEVLRDVRRALDDTASLAHRVYPSLQASGLAAAVRSAAADAGITVQVDVATSAPPDILATTYWCVVGLLDGSAHARVAIRDDAGSLVFEVEADGDADPELLRDRVEALGGRLSVAPSEGGRARVAGSLPF